MIRGLKRLGLAVAGSLMLALPGQAEVTDEELSYLMRALKIPETIEIMRDEGLQYGGELAAEMLPDIDAQYWNKVVTRIYDTDKMYAIVGEGFGRELSETNISPILHFYQSGLGQEVIRLELAARRAFMDNATEDAAQAQFSRYEEDNAPVLDQIEQMIADSDLIEFNVMGALNANLMFYRGLNDSDVYDMTEDEMLSDVWAQEDDVRDDTHDWLNAFLLTAYQPLTPEQLDQYSAFYRTPEGRDLNRAMFGAFDRMYGEISYLLGLAVAKQMRGEDI